MPPPFPNSKEFYGQTTRSYRCLDDRKFVNRELKYKCYYLLNEDIIPKRINCEFTSSYPLFGHESVYGSGGLARTKNIHMTEDSLDNFSSIPTIIWDEFRFDSEHLPKSNNERDLQIFHVKVRKEIEEIIPYIIGDGYCLSHKEVLKLDEKDKKHSTGPWDLDEYWDVLKELDEEDNDYK